MNEPPFEMPEMPDVNKTLAAPPIETSEATQVVTSFPQTSTTQMVSPQQCPICKSFNPPGEVFCSDCGFLMSSAVAPEAAEPAKPLPLLKSKTGMEYYLKQGVNTVGREGADVLLNDPKVSRKHAEIILESPAAWVIDLGSSNGTKLNGTRLNVNAKTAVSNGAVIEFAGIELQLVLPDEFIAEPLEINQETGDTDNTRVIVGLTNVSEPSLNQSFVCDNAMLTIGRSPQNQAVIPNPYVSGRHAELSIQEDRVTLKDLGSSNGTAINDVPLSPNEPVLLHDGDVVVFGQVKFEVKITPKEEPVQAIDESESSEITENEGDCDADASNEKNEEG